MVADRGKEVTDPNDLIISELVTSFSLSATAIRESAVLFGEIVVGVFFDVTALLAANAELKDALQVQELPQRQHHCRHEVAPTDAGGRHPLARPARRIPGPRDGVPPPAHLRVHASHRHAGSRARAVFTSASPVEYGDEISALQHAPRHREGRAFPTASC